MQVQISEVECIADLCRVMADHGGKPISRDFYRARAEIDESAWAAHFGTFGEFKRAAGATPTRQVAQLTNQTAKHSSVDHVRRLNADKAGWDEAYLKPHGSRFQVVMAASDLHDKEMDAFWAFCFIDAVKRIQPDKIVLTGDVFDLPEFGKYKVDPRTWDVVGRIKAVHKFLSALREAAPEAEIVLVEGNHEYRLLRHLAEESPAMRSVLSDLHGFTVSQLLGLTEFEVNYISRSDLGAFTKSDIGSEVKKNYWVGYDCLMANHFPQGRDLAMPGWNGHHHKHIVWPGYNPMFGAYEWHQLGCGHRREADYCDGEKWNMGFLIAHVDTHKKKSTFEYITVADHAVIGGKWYRRQSEEL